MKISIGTAYRILCRGLHIGVCPVCEKRTLFFKKGDWWRDHYHCARCLSIPRQRALVHVLEKFIPDWRNLNIHESSPNGPTFKKFLSECQHYVPTQFFQGVPSGTIYHGYRCEDLAQQTFEDGSFDIVITQDVLEHLSDPVQSLKEICRTLKSGGVHVFTVPWYFWKETKVRVRITNNDVEYLEEPQYHHNPVDDNGALVITEWGRDLIDTIYAVSGMSTTVMHIHDKRIGAEAEFLEVFLSRKPLDSYEWQPNHWR